MVYITFCTYNGTFKYHSSTRIVCLLNNDIRGKQHKSKCYCLYSSANMIEIFVDTILLSVFATLRKIFFLGSFTHSYLIRPWMNQCFKQFIWVNDSLTHSYLIRSWMNLCFGTNRLDKWISLIKTDPYCHLLA